MAVVKGVSNENISDLLEKWKDDGGEFFLSKATIHEPVAQDNICNYFRNLWGAICGKSLQ